MEHSSNCVRSELLHCWSGHCSHTCSKRLVVSVHVYMCMSYIHVHVHVVPVQKQAVQHFMLQVTHVNIMKSLCGLHLLEKLVGGNTPSWHNQDFSMYIDQYICRVTVSQHSNVSVYTLCCVVQRSQSSR